MSIRLNGEDFETFENLAAALHRLRYPKKVRTFWIDALCINQKDKKEKVAQLALMSQIYSNATQVIVWLGEPDDGNRSAMVSLATKNFSIANNMRIWRAQRKSGVHRGWRANVNAVSSGEVDPGISTLEPEIGQVAQLLDRPWWRRVWIVQEVVLAKKIFLMCGSDEVPWESIKERLSADTMYGLNSNTGQLRPLRSHNGTVIDGNFTWPDKEYYTLDNMRLAMGTGKWNLNFYDLLFQFRRFQCSMPEDRIFAYLGLVTAEQSAGINPDYDMSLVQLYSFVARSLIAAHKHLLILNCTRAPYEGAIPYQKSRLYSTLDQGRFVDPQATVVEAHGKPREGWIQLPEGWERTIDDKGTWFRDHTTGSPKQRNSPLKNQTFAPQTVENFRHLPKGWTKDWNNLGQVKFMYGVGKPPTTKTLDLPSWVPDWNCYSARDPEPLPNLSDASSYFWASGKNRPVHFVPTSNPDSGILGVRGMLFDTIDTIASPWFPEGESLPVSRSGVETLVEWEHLALTEPSNCPYQSRGGRANAFWRAHIADYAGHNSLPEKDKTFFDAWCDRGEWTPTAAEIERKTAKTPWQVGELCTENQALDAMAGFVHQLSRDPGAVPTFYNIPKFVYESIRDGFDEMAEIKTRYKEIRSRINKVSVNRAMFITSKGFIGLAPWNAQKGDCIAVLLGGCTPFILRSIGEQYNFIGETYVYGIMGGELFGHEMGHARLKDFEIV